MKAQYPILHELSKVSYKEGFFTGLLVALATAFLLGAATCILYIY